MSAPAPITPEDLEREESLKCLLGKLLRPVLAFSGGVDSSYLLAVLAEVRREGEFLAVLGVSPSLSGHQQETARRVASSLGVRILDMDTAEILRPEYQENRGDRCYWCKDTLYGALRKAHPDATLLDGTQASDAGDFRPGRRAASEQGVRSPLLELGFDKAAIRRLSRARGLETWEHPASPCLASRFPVGVAVTQEGLLRVEKAEAVLREEGFVEFRVRHVASGARIEVMRSEIPRLSEPERWGRVRAGLLALGFLDVTVDPEGFRSGSVSGAPTIPV